MINTTDQLKRILFELFPGSPTHQKFNKIMKVFMALRIAVNNELTVLNEYLEKDPINMERYEE